MKCRLFLIIDRSSKVAVFVYWGRTFLIPQLSYLSKQYPTFGRCLNAEVAINFVLLSIFFAHYFLVWKLKLCKRGNKRYSQKYPLLDSEDERSKLSKVILGILLPASLTLGAYSLLKIQGFLKYDQTINMRRILQLIAWQVMEVSGFLLCGFCCTQLETPRCSQRNTITRIT